MKSKTTRELEDTLLKTHLEDVNKVLNEDKDELFDYTDFTAYMKSIFSEKKLMEQTVFTRADISDRYGYKLISGEKHTNQRDVIIRICFAARFTLEETQRALKLYGMSPLYVRVPRDAYIMAGFNSDLKYIIDLNEYLKENKQAPLKNVGNIE